MIENNPKIIAPCFDPMCRTKEICKTPMTTHMGIKVWASYGMCEASYDIRLAESVKLHPGYTCFGLALEHLTVPPNLRAWLHDKSTSLRLGYRVAGKADPGYHGHLTIEFYYQPPLTKVEGKIYVGPPVLELPAGWPCASVEFEQLTRNAEYRGKYLGADDIQFAR